MSDNNNWQENKLLIISTLNRNEEQLKELHDSVKEVDEKVITLVESMSNMDKLTSEERKKHDKLFDRIINLEKDITSIKVKVALGATGIALFISIVMKFILK